MNAQRPNQEKVRHVFSDAASLAPIERKAFLDEACAGQAALRAEVESLLHYDDMAPEALEPGAFSSPAPAIPDSIGSFQIRGVLGEGGMGVVYHAEQTSPVRRDVALKLIRAGAASPQGQIRFEVECQALALMNHPNIARVLEVGSTEQGQPYLAMEYIAGERITTHCDRHRLTVRQRLDLFLSVCGGVQHAHRRAIIHRDLKASNVLVAEIDGAPTPKIIDFGVAKALDGQLTDKSLATQTGFLVGTPEYMSPEQLEPRSGFIDTRTDVYSLGVLLYELIAGSRPFLVRDLDGAGASELGRFIRESDPPTPSHRLKSTASTDPDIARCRQTNPDELVRLLDGDLDWITLRALEKDPERRYGSPSDLAEDIRRYLKGLPVLASPPSRTYRLRKFVRRHRVGVAVGSALLAVALAFGATLAVQAKRIAVERNRANREAEAALQTAEFLTDLFEVSDPIRARGQSITARELLERGATKIKERSFADPLVRAKLLLTLGQVHLEVGLYDEAMPQLEEAFQLYEALIGWKHATTLAAAQALGTVYWRRHRVEEAEDLLTRLADTHFELFGADDPRTLDAVGSLATLFHTQERYEKALELHTENLERQRSVLGADHPETLDTMNNISNTLGRLGRDEEAIAIALDATERRERVLGGDHPKTLRSKGMVASCLWDLGRFEEAEPLSLEAVDGMRRVLGSDHPIMLSHAFNLAEAYAVQRRFDEAERLLREIRPAQARTIGADDPGTLASAESLAEVLAWTGRLEEAEALFRPAIEALTNSLGADHVRTLGCKSSMLTTLWKLGRMEELERLAREVAEARERTMGPEERPTLRAKFNLAAVYEIRDRHDEALRLYTEVLEVQRRVFGIHEDTGHTLMSIARIEFLGPEPDRAAARVREALEHGYNGPVHQIFSDPHLALPSDPAFAALVAKVRDNGGAV